METSLGAGFINSTARESKVLELTKRVQQKTYRSIKNVEVTLQGTHGNTTLVLKGLSETYYVKQLAQHAVMNLSAQDLKEFNLSHQPNVDNQINVV